MFLFKSFRVALGPTHLLLNGYRGTFLGVKRPGREFNHSPPSTAEVNNDCYYISAYPVCLHGVDKENFTFLYHFTLSCICLSFLRGGKSVLQYKAIYVHCGCITWLSVWSNKRLPRTSSVTNSKRVVKGQILNLGIGNKKFHFSVQFKKTSVNSLIRGNV
jgi:hypothetical protein